MLVDINHSIQGERFGAFLKDQGQVAKIVAYFSLRLHSFFSGTQSM